MQPGSTAHALEQLADASARLVSSRKYAFAGGWLIFTSSRQHPLKSSHSNCGTSGHSPSGSAVGAEVGVGVGEMVRVGTGVGAGVPSLM